MTPPIIFNEPLTGTYKRRRNCQFQIILPEEMRSTYASRQGKKDITECLIYMSRPDGKIILKDNLDMKECPKFNKVSFGLDGRFVARFRYEDSLKKAKDMDFIFRGFYDYVEITRA